MSFVILAAIVYAFCILGLNVIVYKDKWIGSCGALNISLGIVGNFLLCMCLSLVNRRRTCAVGLQ